MARKISALEFQPKWNRRTAAEGRRTAALFFALALLGWSIASGSASARGVLTPLPMQYFCARYPSECRASPPTRVLLDAPMLRLLQQVNADINSLILPHPNPRGGWTIYPGAGDCNDYALTKRSALIRLGVQAGALRMAITTTGSGTAHAILLVRTNVGDFVLDNLSTEIQTLQNSGYTIRIMSGADPLQWTGI